MRRPCRVPNCYRPVASPRVALCSKHQSAMTRHGHPLGRAIPQHTLKDYLNFTSKTLKRHPDHPALVAAEATLAALLDTANNYPGGDLQMADHMGRLGLLGVTPRELLERVGAVFLIAKEEPRVLPDDRRLTFALGRVVLYARPLYRIVDRAGHKRSSSPSSFLIEKIGLMIRGRLGVVFHNLHQSILDERTEAVSTAEALGTPFSSPSTATSNNSGRKSHG